MEFGEFLSERGISGKFRIIGKNFFGGIAGGFYQKNVLERVHGDVWQSGLGFAQKLPRSAHLQVFFRQLKSVFCRHQEVQPFLGGVGIGIGEKQAE